MDQEPSVGRIVHYEDSESDCYAAIITSVDTVNETVNLTVFLPNGGVETKLNVNYFFATDETETNMPDTWHWPERI